MVFDRNTIGQYKNSFTVRLLAVTFYMYFDVFNFLDVAGVIYMAPKKAGKEPKQFAVAQSDPNKIQEIIKRAQQRAQELSGSQEASREKPKESTKLIPLPPAPKKKSKPSCPEDPEGEEQPPPHHNPGGASSASGINRPKDSKETLVYGAPTEPKEECFSEATPTASPKLSSPPNGTAPAVRPAEGATVVTPVTPATKAAVETPMPVGTKHDAKGPEASHPVETPSTTYSAEDGSLPEPAAVLPKKRLFDEHENGDDEWWASQVDEGRAKGQPWWQPNAWNDPRWGWMQHQAKWCNYSWWDWQWDAYQAERATTRSSTDAESLLSEERSEHDKIRGMMQQRMPTTSALGDSVDPTEPAQRDDASMSPAGEAAEEAAAEAAPPAEVAEHESAAAEDETKESSAPADEAGKPAEAAEHEQAVEKKAGSTPAAGEAAQPAEAAGEAAKPAEVAEHAESPAEDETKESSAPADEAGKPAEAAEHEQAVEKKAGSTPAAGEPAKAGEAAQRVEAADPGADSFEESLEAFLNGTGTGSPASPSPAVPAVPLNPPPTRPELEPWRCDKAGNPCSAEALYMRFYRSLRSNLAYKFVDRYRLQKEKSRDPFKCTICKIQGKKQPVPEEVAEQMIDAEGRVTWL